MKTRRHFDHGGFDVRRDRHKLPLLVTITNEPVQRADTSNRERRRTSEPRAGRNIRFRNKMKPGCGFEEVDQLRDEPESLFLQQVFER